MTSSVGLFVTILTMAKLLFQRIMKHDLTQHKRNGCCERRLQKRMSLTNFLLCRYKFISYLINKFYNTLRASPADNGDRVVCFNGLYKRHQCKNLWSRLRIILCECAHRLNYFNRPRSITRLRKKMKNVLLWNIKAYLC